MSTKKDLRVLPEDFEEIIRIIIGESAVIIARMVYNNPGITDMEISQKSNLKVNVIRKVLYFLYTNQLAYYKRVRDKETGWFIYQWYLQPNNLRKFMDEMKRLVLKKLQERLEYEKVNSFYRCINKEHMRITFDEAYENNFKCRICGAVLEYEENNAIKHVLEVMIKRVSKDC